MFCHKCGNKIADDASFCHKCGADLTVSKAALQTPVEPLERDTAEPEMSAASVTGAKHVAPAPTAPTAEGTVEVSALLKENMSRCPVIKAVTQTPKWTVLKGTFHTYIVPVVAGQIKIIPSLAFPFLMLDVMAYVFFFVATSGIGWDLMEKGRFYFNDYVELFAFGLLVGGVIKTITPFLGRKEKEAVATYARDVLEPQGIALAPGTLKTDVSAARLAVSIVTALIGVIVLIIRYS